MTLLVALVALPAAGLERPAERTADAFATWLDGPTRAVEAVTAALDTLIARIGLRSADEGEVERTPSTKEAPSTTSGAGLEPDPWGDEFGCEADPWGDEFGLEPDPWG